MLNQKERDYCEPGRRKNIKVSKNKKEKKRKEKKKRKES